MGKKDYRYVVSVYRFMQCCGLLCTKKPNILVSHEIMMRKLRLRHSKMPDKCVLPKRACRQTVKNDLIKTGEIVLVEDDYGVKLPYYAPQEVLALPSVSQEELAKRRQTILDQYQNETKPMSLGEKRYLLRKAKKLKEEQEKREALKLTKERE